MSFFLVSARPSRVGSADVTGSPAPPSKPDTVTWHALANTMRAGVAPGNRRRGRGSGIGSQVREGAEPAPSGSLPGSRREEKKRPYSSSDFPDGIFFVLIRAVGSEAWLRGARRRTLGAVLPRALVSRPCEQAGGRFIVMLWGVGETGGNGSTACTLLKSAVNLINAAPTNNVY